MKKDLDSVLRYFAFFKYSPTLEEIHTFYPKKISLKQLKKSVERLILTKKLKKYLYNGLNRYTLGGYSSTQIMREDNSTKKIKRVGIFLKLLSLVPQILLVGISGSVAMMNAKKDDDIDLFIISKQKSMFTARFIGLFLASTMGLKRKRGVKKAADKVCLNLFFDISHLQVPSHKKNSYVAHEILQMKPVVNKNNTYEFFLTKNKWVFDRFPNAEVKLGSTRRRKRYKEDSLMGSLIESVLRTVQLYFINRHRTSEIITRTQLWFFPDDFERKIKKNFFD